MTHFKYYCVSDLAYVQKGLWHSRRSCLCTIRLTTNEIEQYSSRELTVPLLDSYGYERKPLLTSFPNTYTIWSVPAYASKQNARKNTSFLGNRFTTVTFWYLPQ
jgi:hypothetical protein